MNPERLEASYLKLIVKVYNGIVPTITREPNNFKLSAAIAKEAVRRFIEHKDLIEDSHPTMKGSDSFKVAGYLSYWITKLKPVLILEPDPDKNEILINEFIAISVSLTYLWERHNLLILSGKIIDDLKYTLRYRVVTVRTLPIIYESYVAGFKDRS
jgi:hypothetical protein